MKEGGKGFWDFSVSLYQRPGVEAALLALQDEDGLDVSLVLFCLYAAMRGEALTEEHIDAMRRIGTVCGRGVVAPLRAARRALKPLAPEGTEAGALRGEVKRIELAAERVMQAELEALVPAARGVPGDRGLAERNLAAWLRAGGLAMAGPRTERLAAVLDAGFGSRSGPG